MAKQGMHKHTEAKEGLEAWFPSKGGLEDGTPGN